MKKAFSIIIVILVLASVAQAQDATVATVRWNAIKYFDGTAGQWISEPTSLVSQGKKKVQWFNANGTMRKSFQVIEVIGEWSNMGTDGTLQYEVTDGQTSGTITFQRNAQEIKAFLVIGTGSPKVYELLIQNTEVL